MQAMHDIVLKIIRIISTVGNQVECIDGGEELENLRVRPDGIFRGAANTVISMIMSDHIKLLLPK
jgi:hypothetical protein